MQPEPSSGAEPGTVGGAIDVAIRALERLAGVGEDVEDEWQYVQDLSSAWQARLEEIAAARAEEGIPPETAVAVDRLAAEAASIDDPHRAIDWLSTLPQAVSIALGERP